MRKTNYDSVNHAHTKKAEETQVQSSDSEILIIDQAAVNHQ